MVQWKTRSKKEQSLVADHRVWESRCGLYKVVFSQIRYGRGLGKKSIPDVYYAMSRLDKNDSYGIISKHRKKNPAIKACEKLAKSLDKEEKKKEAEMSKKKRGKKRC